MTDLDLFWKLERLSNRQLLDSLHQVLRTKRRALAELTAHLGEIEDRRLQLEAAYSSMFDYCVRHLGMSEDEACRRIDLARLARRFPRLFPLLAAGEVSLSVALLLKPVLSEENEVELLAAIRGASIRQAREIIAGRFPQPDVPSVIRKLPERRGAPGMAAAAQGASRTALRHEVGAPVLPVAVARASAAHPMPPEPRADSSSTEVMTPPIPESVTPVSPPAFAGRGAMPRATATRRDNIEPLSSQRYKIQFTADASVKEKLELARDLLRHACPSGDLNSILSRALDLLIADVKRRKFAVGVRAKMPTQLAWQSGTSPATPPSDADCAAPVAEARANAMGKSPPEHDPSELSDGLPSPRQPSVVLEPLTSPAPTRCSSVKNSSWSRRAVGAVARRAVLERDGVRCSWVGLSGARCEARAWLELDHRHPFGKGGASDAENLRLLCRAHNRLAAEQAYGRARIERACAHRAQPMAAQQAGGECRREM